MTNQSIEQGSEEDDRSDYLSFDHGVSIRKYPFPYDALLAFSTDLDGTRTAHEYFELLRFWNSGEPTELGDGLSLQLSNSIYFGMPPSAFSYWNASKKDRSLVRECIEAGLVDTLHSYGDSVTDAQKIDACIEEIERHGMRFSIWSNHAQAPSNFASVRQSTAFAGDDPTSGMYHADKTMGHGIRYAVLGQVSSVIGQGIWPNPLRATIFSVSSIKNTARQCLKMASAPFHPKFRAHLANKAITPKSLKDGQDVYEVLRTNWHPQGVRQGCSGSTIHELVQSKFLEKLSGSRGAAVVYTHLADMFRISMHARINQTMALRSLKTNLERNNILLLTTADLLDYLAMAENVQVNTSKLADTVRIDISLDEFSDDKKQSENVLMRSGLTLSVSSKMPPIITVHGRVPSAHLEMVNVGEAMWRVRFPKLHRKLPDSLSVHSLPGSRESTGTRTANQSGRRAT